MKLRPATMEDSDFLLELKNDPVMRKFAVVTHEPIKKADHVRWLSKHLGEIKIIGDNFGMFRVSDEGEVSINISPNYRGVGLGTEVLKKHCPKGVWAKIVNGNVASMNLFLRNGFVITGYEKGYYVLEY